MAEVDQALAVGTPAPPVMPAAEEAKKEITEAPKATQDGQAWIDSVLKALAEPFPAELIYWKPQATNSDKTRAMGAAYADPRAYSDRLNEVLGPHGWTCTYTMYPIPFAGGDKHPGKVGMIAKVDLLGIGSQSGTGESWADDENAVTAAEAQSFKRATTRFGLGRYLYDLPKGQWFPYDKVKKRFEKDPELPSWALPRVVCQDCKNDIQEVTIRDTLYSVTSLVAKSRREYGGKQLCAACMIKLHKAKTPQNLDRTI